MLARHLRGGGILVTALALAVVSAVYLASRAPQPGSDDVASPDLTAPPAGIAWAAQIHHFEDLATMTATSDLVIRAQVTAIQVGQPEFDPNDPSDQPVLWPRVLTLAVEKVLFSKSPDVPVSLRLYEGYWRLVDDEFVGVEFDGVPWSAVGDRGYFFLKDFLADTPQGGQAYHLVSMQGRALMEAAGLEPAASEHDPVAADIRPMTANQLEIAVGQAASAYDEGALHPQSAGRSAGR